LLEKLKKLEDMQRQLQGALHGWLSQLQQQRMALVSCFGLGDVDTLISNVASEPTAAVTVTPAPTSASQTASIDTFINMMLSSSIPPSPPASGLAATSSVAECVKMSRQNLLYAAIGCRSVLARETAAAAAALGASAGMRAEVESEILVMKQQMQEQQQQTKLHEEQLLATIKTNQVIKYSHVSAPLVV
jgi:hypothetical protein